LDHEVIEIDLSLSFSFKVGVEEFREINLKVFKKADASGKSITVKGRSNFNKGSNGVGGTEFGKFHEGFSGGVGGDGLKFGDDDFKSVEHQSGLFLSGEEIFMVLSSLGSGGNFLFIKHDEGSFTGLDILLEDSLSGSEGFDGNSSFGNFVGGVVHSGLESSELVFAFSHFGGMTFVSSGLLLSKVGHHVSDEVGNVLHWGSGGHLESNGIKEVFTEIGFVDVVKGVLKLIVTG